MTLTRRSRATLGALVAAATALAGASHLVPDDRGIARGATAPPYGVTITTKVDARGRGTFTLSGGLADAGRASARRAVVNGRLVTRAVLAGAKGRISLTSSQPCARAAGTWRAVSGTATYAGIVGRGTTGRGLCTRPFRAATTVLRGTVTVPPVPLARPGAYGGWTAEDKALAFTVRADGRTIGDVLVGGYRYECVRSDGVHIRASSEADRVFPGPYPIAEDRSFGLKLGVATIAGRFAGAGATGTITVQYGLPADPSGRTSTCSGSIAWTVSMPPPPPRRALAGTYCGFSKDGQGVCLDVSDGGVDVRNVRVGVLLSCGDLRTPTRVPIRFIYDVPIPVHSDLSFARSYIQQIEDSAPRVFLSGTFDQNGSMTGALNVSQTTSVTRDGVRLTCRPSSASFTASLQR